MPIPESEHELTALFRELGAPDPEQWAKSQAMEGIPQMLRFLFLRNAWQCVAQEGDSKWIEREMQDASDLPPFAVPVIPRESRVKGTHCWLVG